MDIYNLPATGDCLKFVTIDLIVVISGLTIRVLLPCKFLTGFVDVEMGFIHLFFRREVKSFLPSIKKGQTSNRFLDPMSESYVWEELEKQIIEHLKKTDYYEEVIYFTSIHIRCILSDKYVNPECICKW